MTELDISVLYIIAFLILFTFVEYFCYKFPHFCMHFKGKDTSYHKYDSFDYESCRHTDEEIKTYSDRKKAISQVLLIITIMIIVIFTVYKIKIFILS